MKHNGIHRITYASRLVAIREDAWFTALQAKYANRKGDPISFHLMLTDARLRIGRGEHPEEALQDIARGLMEQSEWSPFMTSGLVGAQLRPGALAVNSFFAEMNPR